MTIQVYGGKISFAVTPKGIEYRTYSELFEATFEGIADSISINHEEGKIALRSQGDDEDQILWFPVSRE